MSSLIWIYVIARDHNDHQKGKFGHLCVTIKRKHGSTPEAHLTTNRSQNKDSTGACPVSEQLNEAAVFLAEPISHRVTAGMSWKQPNCYFTSFTVKLPNC